MNELNERPKYTLIIASNKKNIKNNENDEIDYIEDLINYYQERYP